MISKLDKHLNLFILIALFLSIVLLISTLSPASQNASEQSQTPPSYLTSPLAQLEITHKVIAPTDALDPTQDGISLWHDYGAFALYKISDSAFKGLSESTKSKLRLENESDRILIDAYPFNTQTDNFNDMPQAYRLEQANGAALHLIQFVGPIKDAWLEKVKASGATPIHYIKHNAYLVWADDAARSQLDNLAHTSDFMQFSAPYHPYFKLGPSLNTRLINNPNLDTMLSDVIPVTIQIYNHPAKTNTQKLINSLAITQLAPWDSVLDYQNIRIEVKVGDIPTIAAQPDVFWIGEYFEPTRFDEVQSQILAGNFDGSQSGPSGTGYKAWLDSYGFSTTPGDYPLVDIVDDGIGNGTVNTGDRTLHQQGSLSNPSRVVYVANCTNAADGGGPDGHGHININIAGGYDTSAGFPFRDPNGYQRGAGINPYGRFAGTRIFDPNGFDLSNCNNTVSGLIKSSQDNGAEISSNSWGCGPCAGSYDTNSQAYDVGVRDADLTEAGNQEMITIFAAGNDGAGSATIGTPGNGKNMITVGASENDRPSDEDGSWFDGCGTGPTGASNAMDVIDFSSRGPAPGGRVKPEIIAPGTHIQGTASTNGSYNGSGVCDQYRPSGQSVFAASSGTSHSTPAVSGVASLYYYWLETNYGFIPTPALMKSYLIAHPTYLTGVDANDDLPSNNQGYGMPNMSIAFDNTPRQLVNQSHIFDNSGEVWTFSGIVADPSKPIRIVMAYTDKAGATGTSPQVNDLNLEVIINGTTYLGNNFSGQWSVGGGSADTANNYEAVFMPAGTNGDITVRVTAFNIADDGIPNTGDSTDQDFALVCYNCTEETDFTLAVSPNTVAICTADNATYNISLAPIGPFTDLVTLSAIGQPNNSTPIFADNPVSLPASTTLTISDTQSTTFGSYPIDIIASGGGIIHTKTVTLNVFDRFPGAVSLNSPPDGENNVSNIPNFMWTDATQGSHYYLEVASDETFNTIIYTATVEGNSHLAATSLNSNATYYWRITPNNTCGAASPSSPFMFSTQSSSLVCDRAEVTFENGIPADWTVVDNTNGAGIVWTTTQDAACEINNLTNGSGEAACVDSDASGSGSPPYDTELLSPPFNLTGDTISLNVAAYYRDLVSGNDHFEIDIWDGTTWTSLLSWDEDHEPEDITLDLSAYSGQTGLQIRFRYFGNGFDWYAQVDNVALVCGVPIIATEPNKFAHSQAPNTLITHTLTLSNLGTVPLTWTISEDSKRPVPSAENAPNVMENTNASSPPLKQKTRPSINAVSNNNPSLAQPAPLRKLTDVINDGGFEAGTPNPYWNEVGFGGFPVICAASNCGSGTIPRTGSYTAWFGGFGGSSSMAISQTLTIPKGKSTLSFWLLMGVAPGATGYLNISIDGNPTLLSFDETDGPNYITYTQASVYVGDYADGSAHTIQFSGGETGGGNLNFFVDDVVLDVVPLCSNPSDIPWVSVSPASGTIAQGSADTSQVIFDSSGLGTGVYNGVLCVNSNDPTKAQTQIPLTLTIPATVNYDFTLSPSESTQIGTKGDSVVHTLRLTNTGNIADFFDINIIGQTWPTTSPTPIGPLDAGQSTDVIITVDIDPGATPNTTDIASINVASQGTGANTNATVTTVVTGITPVYSLTITPPSNTKSAYAGQTLSYTLWLTNTGNTTDTYNLTANSTWASTLPFSSVTLAASTGLNLVITVDIPSNALGEDADETIINAVSQIDTAISAQASLISVVNPTYGVIVAPDSSLVGYPGDVLTHSLWITNTGNITDLFNLSVTSTWAINPPSSVGPLAPNTGVNIAIAAQIPADAYGNEQDNGVVTAVSQKDNTVEDSITLSTAVISIQGVHLKALTNTLKADAGHSVTYTIHLTNTGNVTDSFNIDSSSIWNSTPSVISVGSLAIMESVTFTVKVDIPPDAFNNANDTAIISASSHLNSNVQDTLSLTTFGSPPTYTLQVRIVGSGTVTLASDGTLILDPLGNIFTENEQVSLTATPAPNWYFAGWSGDLAGIVKDETLIMDSDKVVTATFTATPPPTYTLSVTVVGSGTVALQGQGTIILDPIGGIFQENAIIQLKAIPASGWYFTGWHGDLFGIVNPESLTMDGDKVITATFSNTPPPTYTLSITVVGNGTVALQQGTVILDPTDGIFQENTILQLRATPNPGWLFVGWQGDLTGTTPIESVVMTSDKVITASFVPSITTVYGVDIAFADSSLSAYPAQTVSYTLWLSNTGNTSDTFDIAVTNFNWTTTVANSVGPVPPNVSTSTIIAVSIPFSATSGMSDKADVTVTSHGDGAISASTSLTTLAIWPRVYVPIVMKPTSN